MPIDTPEAVKFCNERVRPLADRLAQLYYEAKSVVDEYDAAGMSKAIPADDSVVSDGADRDGRHPLTGVKAAGIIDLARGYVSDFETGLNAKLGAVLSVAVQTRR